jgi:hypothetical protein
MKFWHKVGSIAAHVGLGTVAIGASAGPWLPAPFNLIVGGSAVAAMTILHAKGINTLPVLTIPGAPQP